jgi:hypothetical protein
MESPIDERYRLTLIARYLQDYEESSVHKCKAKFFCPLCQGSRKSGRYYQKKGAYFWHQASNSWRFNCVKCHPAGMSMYSYLLKINAKLASEYQMERWHSGTTGKGHDCPNPNLQVLELRDWTSTAYSH